MIRQNQRNGHYATSPTGDRVNYKTTVSRYSKAINTPGHVLECSVCCHGDITEMHIFYILAAFMQILYANVALAYVDNANIMLSELVSFVSFFVFLF